MPACSAFPLRTGESIPQPSSQNKEKILQEGFQRAFLSSYDCPTKIRPTTLYQRQPQHHSTQQLSTYLILMSSESSVTTNAPCIPLFWENVYPTTPAHPMHVTSKERLIGPAGGFGHQSRTTDDRATRIIKEAKKVEVGTSKGAKIDV